MKKITFLIFLISPVISFAQVDFGSATASAMGGAVTASAKDWEAIGINPANLGYKENHAISMSIMNVGINVEDNAITIPEARQLASHIGDTLTLAEANQFYQALTAPGGFNINTTITWAALSFSIPKIGGFAVSLEDEIYAHIQLNPNLASILINGVSSSSYNDSVPNHQLASQAFQGSTAGAYHYRELNIDYGHKLLTINIHGSGKGGASFENSEYLKDKVKTSDTISNPLVIYGGLGVKPIWGLGDYNGTITGGQNIENGTFVYNDPGYTNNILSNIFSANGRGLGVDLGLSATYKKWRLGLSAIDLGKINWQNNSFLPASVYIPTLTSKQAGGITDGDFGITQAFVNNVANASPNYTTELPSKFRSGISYQLTRGIAFSGDFVAPLNNVQGNILNPYYVVGAHINFFKIFSFSAGYATEKGFGNLVPAGVFLNFLGGFEIFVATDDVLAYVNQSKSHVISASFGIKLFGF